ncbi:hypothetical protein MMC24_003361 [Lignoscripta atroalba]|nr:hypothetical protein [Lignoscripta atroalba]
MACLLYVYARTGIQAGKRNAQRHREADGGQISWRNESLRRHGALEKPEHRGPIRQLVVGARDKVAGRPQVEGTRMTQEEELIRARKGKRKANEE